MRTKHGAKKLAKQLCAAAFPRSSLHGNLSQSARERNLADFSSGQVRVLVATDIAARGIHVDDIALVVHVDPPAEHKAFLHRSGRTARAGAEGVVATVMTPDQAGDVRVTRPRRRHQADRHQRRSIAPAAQRAVRSTRTEGCQSHSSGGRRLARRTSTAEQVGQRSPADELTRGRPRSPGLTEDAGQAARPVTRSFTYDHVEWATLRRS